MVLILVDCLKGGGGAVGGDGIGSCDGAVWAGDCDIVGVWVSGVEGGVVGVAEEGGGEFVVVMGG